MSSFGVDEMVVLMVIGALAVAVLVRVLVIICRYF